MANRSARALVVELVADVTEFVKGTQKADDALADFVTDTEAGVRDINRATDKLGDNITDPFQQVGTSAKDAADDAERAFDNLAREANRSFDKIDASNIDVDLAGEGVKHQAGEAGKEVAGEFAMNLGSSLASGDTKAVITDSIGGVIGPLAMAGPIGLAVASGGAIALGLWQSFMKKTQEEKERALGLIESFWNETDRLTQEHVREQESLKFLGEDDIAQQKELLRLSNNLGLSRSDILKLIQGTHPEQAKIMASLETISQRTAAQKRGWEQITAQQKASDDLLSDINGSTKAWGTSQDTVTAKIQTGVASLEEIQNFNPIKLADPKNLQDSMAAVNSWNTLDPRKKVTLDIITSQEDQRKINAFQSRPPATVGGRALR